MSLESAGSECYTDFALQEYAAGRLDADVRTELAGHLQTCDACRQALAAFEAESRLLRAALTAARTTGAGEPSDETLALYLDGALDESAALALETAISQRPALLARLIQLRIELTAVRRESDEGAPDTRIELEGRILKMPRRVKPVVTLTAIRRASGEKSN